MISEKAKEQVMEDLIVRQELEKEEQRLQNELDLIHFHRMRLYTLKKIANRHGVTRQNMRNYLNKLSGEEY